MIKEKNVIEFIRYYEIWCLIIFIIKCIFLVLLKFDVILEFFFYGFSSRNLMGIKVVFK